MSAFWGVSPKCVLEILVFDLPFEAKNLSCIDIESQVVYISLHCILWLFTPRWWTLLSSSFTPANAECFAIGECSKDVYNHFVYCKISDLTGIHISGIFETEQSHLKITVCLRKHGESWYRTPQLKRTFISENLHYICGKWRNEKLLFCSVWFLFTPHEQIRWNAGVVHPSYINRSMLLDVRHWPGLLLPYYKLTL